MGSRMRPSSWGGCRKCEAAAERVCDECTAELKRSRARVEAREAARHEVKMLLFEALSARGFEGAKIAEAERLIRVIEERPVT